MNASSFPYVPTHINEELLFSWISRLHFLNVQNNPRRTLAGLFGSHTGIPSADLPCRLQKFVECTAPWGPFDSVDDVAKTATLFPYYGLFLNSQRYRSLFETMRNDHGNGLKLSLGLVANGFGASVTLRSCRDCDSECIAKNGCTILHRVHQLPYVLVCPIHGQALYQHFLQSQQSHRQRLVVPTRDLSAPSINIGNRSLHRIAKLSNEALTITVPQLSATTRSQVYFWGIAKHGFIRNGRTDWDALAKAVKQEYEGFGGFQCKHRLMSTEQWPMRWLYDLCRRPERSLHPLCHLLLIGFLFGDIRKFFLCAENLMVPTPTIDPIAAVRNEKKIDVELLNSLLTDETLSCRQIAKKVDVSTNTVVMQRRKIGVRISERPKKFNKLKLEEVKKLLREGIPVETVASQTGFSLSSVYRILALLPDVQKIRQMQTRQTECLLHRSQWLDARRKSPEKGTKQLRVIAGGAYAWLYRHDREWLSENTPKRPKGALSSYSKVNWPERDQLLADAAAAEAVNLSASLDGKRISVTALLRATGFEANACRNLNRLPALARAIAELAESDAAFYERRRTVAHNELLVQGDEAPAEWRIQRVSRLRKRDKGVKN
ncbi:TnsD family Tn7-like transposition protein [Noviherbaspirillum sp. 1P10PC]|uniref:TnsD family Tn7-like transposition protein n=1 Tax=Noviherbaspirillum sp. 1P10PC TaxID=3132292 RepID=UPI0039A2A3B5